MVELAHEALVNAWPRLRGWLEDDSEGLRILRHLSTASDSWVAMGRPDSELYRGARLEQARAWRERAEPDLAPDERAFLEASQALEASELATAEDVARRQRRANRRLRVALVATGSLLLIAALAGSAALRSAGRADRSAEAATAERIGS